jgi:hypothetical protein
MLISEAAGVSSTGQRVTDAALVTRLTRFAWKARVGATAAVAGRLVWMGVQMPVHRRKKLPERGTGHRGKVGQ